MRNKALLVLALAAALLAACRAPSQSATTATAFATAAATAPATVAATPTTVPLATATTSAVSTPIVRPTAASAATLRVFADEALRESFAELANAYTNLTPGVQVDLVFAPSAELIARLRRGDAADVVALAGDATLREAVSSGLVEEVRTTPIAEDRLAVVTPRQAAPEGLATLARPETRLALARADTPLGVAARAALERLIAEPPADWATIDPPPTIAGMLDTARRYDDAPAIIAALQASEVDVALLYQSAVTPLLEDQLRQVALPRDVAQPLRYSVARLSAAARPDDADQFVDLLASAAGQATLSAYNFYPIVSSATGPAPLFPTLDITGAVDRRFTLSAEQLAQRPQIAITVQDHRGETRRFEGISLKRLIEEARPQPGAHTLILRGSDDYAQEAPLAFISMCADCIVATLDDGSLQAILPGYDPSAWVRLLVQIEVE